MSFQTGPVTPSRFEHQGGRVSAGANTQVKEAIFPEAQDTSTGRAAQDQGETRRFANMEFEQKVSFGQPAQSPEADNAPTSSAVQFGGEQDAGGPVQKQLSSTRSEIRELRQQIQQLEASIDGKGLFSNRRQLGKQLEQLQSKLSGLEQRETRLQNVLRIPELKAAYQAMNVNVEMTTEMRKQQVSPGAQNAIDVIEYYRLSPEVRPSGEAPALELEQGMDLVYTSLVSGFNDPEKTQSARTLFQQLQATPDMPLSSEQEQLLEGYGLVRDGHGQIINYMNKQAVSSQDLADFTQVIDHQVGQFLTAGNKSLLGSSLDIMGDLTGVSQSLLNPLASVANQATNQIFGGTSIGVSDDALQHLRNSQADLKAKLDAVKAETVALRQQLGIAQQQITQLETNKTQVEAEIQISEGFIRAFDGLETAADFEDFVRNASPQQLAWMQQQGLEVENNAGEIALRLNGETIDSVDALTRFKTKAIEQRDALAARLNDLENQIAQAETAVDGVKEQLEGLNTSETELNDVVANHDEAVVEARAERERLLAIKNDPVAWAALSPQEQAQIDDLITQYDAALSESEALQAETVQVQAEVNNVQSEAESFIQEAEQIIEGARAVLTQGQSVLQDLDHLIGVLDRQLEKAIEAKDAEVRDAIAKANELASRLSLAPQPQRIDVSTLFSDWQDILADASETYHRLSAEMTNSQTIERTRMQQFAEQLREMHEYTQDYLQNIDDIRSEEINQMLSHIQGLEQVMV